MLDRWLNLSAKQHILTALYTWYCINLSAKYVLEKKAIIAFLKKYRATVCQVKNKKKLKNNMASKHLCKTGTPYDLEMKKRKKSIFVCLRCYDL